MSQSPSVRQVIVFFVSMQSSRNEKAPGVKNYFEEIIRVLGTWEGVFFVNLFLLTPDPHKFVRSG